MIYIIDHEDSFTWNVVHQFSAFDEVYCSNYFEIDTKKLNKANTIVFSPGPGSPSDYPLTSKIYKRYKGKKKIIFVCNYTLIIYDAEIRLISNYFLCLNFFKCSNRKRGIQSIKLWDKKL